MDIAEQEGLEVVSESASGIGTLTGILAVDVRRFGSGYNDVQQERIVALLPEILKDACGRAGISELIGDNMFRAFRGDGYLIGFSPDLIVPVVDKFFDSLQATLRQLSGSLRADGIELRLRASLHLGPVQSFNEIIADSPTGGMMVESGRMVDAEPVRALLENSDPEVTFVAVVLSESIMEHVVRAGRTARRPSEFVASSLIIDSKDYSGKGYLRVPVLSGDLLVSGLLRGQLESSNDAAERIDQMESVVTNKFAGQADKVTQARDVHGGIHDHSVRADYGIAVRGNGNTAAGGDIDRSVGKQEFSGEFRTRGDANFGPSSGSRVDSRHDEKQG
ncbi:hypothetical protein ABZ805_24650 [Saccharopolyspora sp. NPDC047091]|uniref:hypothetical protein n=1 Tax=Saccharopolyspora sp. NPDC047091 TaxID=3155924 RepID=UPI0033E8A8E1